MRLVLTVCLGLLLAGCGGSQNDAKSPAGKSSSGSGAAGKGDSAVVTQKTPKKNLRKPLSIGGTPNTTAKVEQSSGKIDRKQAHDALKPLQIVLGKWNGVTRKKINGFGNRESLEWIWDFKTDPQRPALVMSLTAKPTYFKSARLSFLGNEKYRLAAIDKEGKPRVYEGGLTQPVREVPSDDGKRIEKTFELTLDATRASRDLARVVIKQQNNDRYLFQVYDRRGERVVLDDTINTLRDGTSFAKKLDEYGDRTCVVSQGLGTTAVSYKGKTYYVCCSGCRAAFEEEPEKWIAAYEEWKLKNGKK